MTAAVKLATPKETGADIEGEYRYLLWRSWRPAEPHALFVMLNPSTADATEDDPTIRRCVAFARDWGHGGLVVANLFSLRATDPRELRGHIDPIGPRTDETLRRAAKTAGVVVAAWGCGGHLLHRNLAVARLLRGIAPLHHLRLTKHGDPSHPLYLPKSLTPTPWVTP